MVRGAHFIVVLGLLPLVACAGASSAPATPAGAAKPAAAKPAARPSPAVPGAPGAKPTTPAEPVEGPAAYVYEAQGRRDPFTNLLNTGAVDPRGTLSRGEGLAGLLVNEIVVRAVVESRAKTVALIQGPDGRSYNIHAGDKLLDGTVTSINPQGLVIMQVVNDPLSTQKQREVRKLLRSLEEAK
jgi:Tfp pilus assembly protein PilP